MHDDLGVLGQGADTVDVGWAPDVGDTGQNGMRLVLGIDDTAGALSTVVSVVIQPGVAENQPPPAASGFSTVEGEWADFAVLVAAVIEGVCCGAETDDGLATVSEVDDVFHLLVRKLAKTKKQDHQVSRVEGLQPGNVGLVVGLDHTGFGVDGKQHGAFEPVADREDLGEHRHALFGSILIVPGDKDNVLAGSGALATWVNDPRIRFGSDHGGHQAGEERRGQ